MSPYPRPGGGDPFAHDNYYLKRHLLKMVGSRFSIYVAGSEQPIIVADRKGFKLKEEIRLHPVQVENPPLVGIFAQQVIDFSAQYDVVDLTNNTKIGAFKRKGWSSMIRDEWQVFDPYDRPIGSMVEDSMLMALLRRFATNLIPQNYDLLIGERRAADLKQNFNPFSYHLNIICEVPAHEFDRRMVLAGAVLLGSIEGRQSG